MDHSIDHREYFKAYRATLGFTNQRSAKDFLAGKDILPGIDYEYISELVNRLNRIVNSINQAFYEQIQRRNIEQFCKDQITGTYQQIKEAGILPRLNNQGRRPEQVLFSWLRGYAIAQYLLPSLGHVFGVKTNMFRSVGDDDFTSFETFKRTPRADFELTLGTKIVILEIQSGYQGINDIKQHKVLVAKKQLGQSGKPTVCIHLDTFNGQIAMVRLDKIEESDINWITRQQMEGQTVFNIDQGLFAWRIMDPPPTLESLQLGL